MLKYINYNNFSKCLKIKSSNKNSYEMKVHSIVKFPHFFVCVLPERMKVVCFLPYPQNDRKLPQICYFTPEHLERRPLRACSFFLHYEAPYQTEDISVKVDFKERKAFLFSTYTRKILQYKKKQKVSISSLQIPT